jgi:hypothetical protein
MAAAGRMARKEAQVARVRKVVKEHPTRELAVLPPVTPGEEVRLPEEMVDPLPQVGERMVPPEGPAARAQRVEVRTAPPTRDQAGRVQGVEGRAVRPIRDRVVRVLEVGQRAVAPFGRESLRQAGSPAVQILPNRVGRRKGFWG